MNKYEKFEPIKLRTGNFPEPESDVISIEDNCDLKNTTIYLSIQEEEDNVVCTTLNQNETKLFINKMIEAYEIMFEEEFVPKG